MKGKVVYLICAPEGYKSHVGLCTRQTANVHGTIVMNGNLSQ